MAEKKCMRKGGPGRFALGMVVYAAVFLIGLDFGLRWFWGYMASYEASRPQNTVDAYMAQLTPERICDASADWIASLDLSLQSREQCRQEVLNAVSGDISCAKKVSECTDQKQVYVLRRADRIIGSFTITSGEADEQGFTYWTVTNEQFDFSYLLREPVSVTVASDLRVYVNGTTLSEDYITEDGIHYELLERFYEDYELPYMVTYQAGPFLGEPELIIKDAQGNVVEDPQGSLDNCTEAEKSQLNTFLNRFVGHYVTYTSNVNEQIAKNYKELMRYVVSDSALAKRLYDAIDGLQFAQSRGDAIAELTVNHYVNIGDDRYLCDVTYLVNTIGKAGIVQTTNNVQIIVVKASGGLKAEAMTSY